MIARLLTICASLVAASAHAEEMTLAVASNFLATAEDLAARFEAKTGHDVVVAHGSTGQLYAQIVNGAPFDIFLSADAERPDLLAEEGRADEVAVYAIGRLALVGRAPFTLDALPEAMAGKTVALADPTVAPYGDASITAMERLSLDTGTFRPILVANVGQVATVFATGNADFAFVAEGQLPTLGAPHVALLEGIAPDVVQSAALLTDAPGAARDFWQFLFADEARRIIEAAGYGVPE